MATASARAKFRRRVRDSLKRADEAFKGTYQSEISGLLGLSETQINQITPDETDLQAYNNLISIVKEASRMNAEATDLRDSIIKTGEVAVKIAKMVPSLARIL